MKTIPFLALFIGSITYCYAQDLIVTNLGDSLNCKISRVKDTRIYFTFEHHGEMRKTLYPLDKVTFYDYNYYKKKQKVQDTLSV